MEVVRVVYMNLNIWRKIFKFVFVHTKNIQTKMNACKDFHSFTCISMIKTCVTELVLKNKNVNSQVVISIKAG